MKLTKTRLHILKKHDDLSNIAKSGISMHCHTRFSQELLDFIPYYAEQIPIISYFWRKEQEKYLHREGKLIDFTTGYWTPPLTEELVFQSEKHEINRLGLEAVVSITDHDCIQANLNLCETNDNAKTPISMEWTVPFEFGFFHLGIHNLPKHSAQDIADDLLNFTFAKERGLKFGENRLSELFEMLNEIPDILIVFNHPAWDIEMIGKERHTILLKLFIEKYSTEIHALELNGFRTWSENKEVIDLSETLGIPLVTGGDRHGCKPNTVINLTKSTTFSEFVDEIRIDKQSEIAILPEYKQPLVSRQLQCFSDILGFYPDFAADRQRWTDRVFYDIRDGNGLQKISTRWNESGPAWLRAAIVFLKFLGNENLLPIIRQTVLKKDILPADESSINFYPGKRSESLRGSLDLSPGFD
jgi:hypothetical protein